NVGINGTYKLDFRVASNGAGGKFHLEVDGKDVTGALSVPNTGGWQTFKTIEKTGVYLAAGPRALRLVMDSGGATGAVGNFNYLTISPDTLRRAVVSNSSAFVRDGADANTNFGADPQLLVKKSTSGFDREAFVQFDVSTIFSVTNAKLRLFG